MSSRRERTHARSAPHLLLAALVALGGVMACGSDGTAPEEQGIEGEWVLDVDIFTVYLEVTSGSLTLYNGVESQCFFVTAYTIVSRDGDRLTLRAQGESETFQLILRREGDELRLIDPTSPDATGDLFSAADVDLAALQQCGEGAGGADPAIDCSTLPAIAVGDTIDGDLATGDASFFGSYYDLYGLTLSAATPVIITQASDQIDAYLYLYEADGTYITEDDDTGGALNAAISLTLDPGCYRIEATSWAQNETGPYSLTVE